jgi:hypothetical protein
MRRAILLIGSAMLLSSCYVANRVYNPATGPASEAGWIPRSVVQINNSVTLPDRLDADCVPSTGHPCMAFVEFDEQGEFWDNPAQGNAAIDLIKRARAKNDHTIVITFLHGWKNNADDRLGRQNHNITGFEGALEYLATKEYPNLPIVGVFMSWRGDLVPDHWPARRQFSYFNREAAAIRIPGASMTAFLTRVMIDSHVHPKGTPTQTKLIMVGHSFGGLALERALAQATTDYVTRQGNGSTTDDDEAAWADLVVFVNSAAAATEGIQMLDFLKRSQIGYRAASGVADAKQRTAERPLLLTISSLGDTATRFAMPIGHALPFVERKVQGSWRGYQNLDPRLPQSQSSYFLSTTAHMEALQSHLIVDTSNPQDAARCLMDPKNPSSAVNFGSPFATQQGFRYQICERPGRWNDTPYWAMQMPATIVPDHGHIFNTNFINLLKTFFPSQAEMATPSAGPRLRQR